jgi:L,D-peptidoglycan transpeptidase YkuD (ErfK/YbiS/YcfS/YnhG family)
MPRIRLPILALLLAACAPAACLSQSGPAGDALQMVVVTTADWDATTGTMRRYERESASAPWRPVGDAFAVTVGRTGLAWGRGLHGEVTDDGPRKREGDGKAPAGVFALSAAFGYAEEAPWVRLPYHSTDASVECVDDARSRFYNRLVDRDTVPAPDWTSHEEMRRPDELYRLGVWVDHNTAPTEPGGGSCIFLHLWRAPGAPTVGCTAMAPASMDALLRWLDPRARPVLVQLPEDHYSGLRGEWGLP